MKKWLLNKKKWLIIFVFLIFPLLCSEVWVQHNLFNYVSYTNSKNMDPQIHYFEANPNWKYVALGSSEVKWGIDPAQIDQAFAEKNISASGFNLGFDGFNESFYLSILPFLNLPERLPELKLALIGINLIEKKQILPSSLSDGFPCDGILQSAVLKSSFAKDYNLEKFCKSTNWTQPIVKALEKSSSLIRYRQALRTLLIGYSHPTDLIGSISNGLEQYKNGFHAHKPAQDNSKEVEKDYQRFLDDKKNHPELFEPMEKHVWLELVKEEGFFDYWHSYFFKNNILPVFFALPTNPVMIDAQHRREDYQLNSKLMQEWANRNNVVFIDLGILDQYNQYQDYSDHRHLSIIGARQYSKELGLALAENHKVISKLSQNNQE